MLHQFLRSHREELISRCRVKVAQRQAPRATGRELDYGISVFLAQVTQILREESPDCEAASDPLVASTSPVGLGIEMTAVRHGNELLLKGFTVDQVVHDYGDLCQAVTELAIELGLSMEVDRQILAGALANLLQNAFKFTRTGGRVSLKSFSSDDRVLIEVEDECGGLPAGEAEDLFRPFEQRGGDRSGLGLGLGISRRGVVANGGKLYVRDLPGKGCLFTIELPNPAVAKSAHN
jgi:signal transduction histidine kinase